MNEGILMTGIVRDVEILKSKKDNKPYAIGFSVESRGKDNDRVFVKFSDFDLNQKYTELQKLENMPVYAEVFGKSITYHPVREKGGNGSQPVFEQKKPFNPKV